MISCSATSLLLLLLAAASLLTAAVAEDAGCTPATCGNLTFTYPFWLAGGSNGNLSSCGPPAFLVSCDDGSVPAAAFLSNSYIKVLRVDYDSRSVVAVHRLVTADAACSIMFNVSSAFAITDRFRISQSNRELYVLSCRDRQPPPGSVPVTNCSSSANSSGIYAYLGGNYGKGQPPVNHGSCQIAVFPVLGSSEPAEMTAANYRRLIKGGFLLECEPVGDCDACRASGGRCRYDATTAMFACLCSNGGMRTSTCDVKHRRNLSLIASLSAAATFALICLAYLMYHYKRKFRSAIHRAYSSNTANAEEMLRKCGSLSLKRYRYWELKKITRSFRDELGAGGYGVVYKGILKDGRLVAVKLLKESMGNGEDFLNEVMSIGQTSHINIVTLLGFCLERSKRALVYEFMPGGSLKKHIYSERSKLETGWEALLKIAVGIARGLEYLHQGCNTRIIHFDIKPNNILLGDDLRPKIADFGLAKLCHLKDSVVSTAAAADARGTVGFIAPEVYSRGFGVVSTKSDVYSYGMLLLEMVRGKEDMKKAVDGGGGSGEAFYPHWVHDRLARELSSWPAEGGCREARDDGSEEVARKMTMVGLWCIQMTPETRPSMSRAIEMLERSIGELEMPPKPFMISTPLYSTDVSSYASDGAMMSAS